MTNMLDSNFWKKYFEVYDVLNLLIPYQELLESICEELDIKEGEKILEAGCGTGNLALKIKEKGAEVIGIDNCKEALEICKKKDPSIEVVFADLTKPLPFPDNYFDKIASNNTLYTLPKEKHLEVLRELKRILKPGGKIVLSDPKKGAKPFKVYRYHIKRRLERVGLMNTLKDIASMAVSTLRMFYFNKRILKEKERFFFDSGELEKVLRGLGFCVVRIKIAYAFQGVLVSAIK